MLYSKQEINLIEQFKDMKAMKKKRLNTKFVKVSQLPYTLVEVSIDVPDEIAVKRFREKQSRTNESIIHPGRDKKKLRFFAQND